MWFVIKKSSLGIALIAAASAVLLWSDVQSGTLPRIAIFQQTSTAVLDDGVHGMVDGLAENGFRDGETAVIVKYNAQNDAAMANAIAREITDGRYDLVMSSSTPSLQAVANANKAGRTRHVFGLVADPYVADVGLDPKNPLGHPPHMVGYGILLPAGDAFRIARKMLPSLKRVGVAWNPSEANSRMFMGLARAVCKELDISLLEAAVENTAGVPEAIQSLISRDAQALWVGGDVTVSSVLGSILPKARQARIPVFSILPGDPQRGTLFDLGLDFYQGGRLCGELAAQILKGADPAAIPIRDSADIVGRRLMINLKVIEGLKDPWRLPDDLRREADVLVDESGVHSRSTGKPGKP